MLNPNILSFKERILRLSPVNLCRTTTVTGPASYFLPAFFVDLSYCYVTCKITTLMLSENSKLLNMNNVLQMMMPRKNQSVTLLDITVWRNGA